MKRIKNIKALEVLDSRSNPTLKVTITLDDGTSASSIIPSGASKGEKEAYELRDNDLSRFNGKGVLKAVDNVNSFISKELIGHDVDNQELIDKLLIDLDGTNNKCNLGANAILATSIASFKLNKKCFNFPFNEFMQKKEKIILPVPLINIINGGAHSNSNIDFQEYLLIPAGFNTFKDALRASVEIYHKLKEVLKENNYSTNVGDEGGYSSNFKNSNEEPLKLILEAIKRSNYKEGKEIFIGLDVASSEFYIKEKNVYNLKKSNEGIKTSEEMIEYYKYLINKYPIISIEDGLSEFDNDGWVKLTKELGNKIQLVGDDLFVTNYNLLQNGINNKIANAILIKPNQIGTISETLNTIKLAKDNDYNFIISHRSGDTEDTFIADLSVLVDAKQIKTGSVSRSERTCKYNRLLEIEDKLKDKITYLGIKAFKKI